MITSTGNAIAIKPFSTSTTNINGNSTTKHTIFAMLQVAFIAKSKIFPNITNNNIMNTIMNSKPNIIFTSSFTVYHELI